MSLQVKAVRIKCGEECENPPCGEEPPGGKEDDEGNIESFIPIDPNDIIGPWGYGEQNWIGGENQPWPYLIRFENDPEEATATAAVVRIEQVIDPSLDLDSFRFGDFGFGSFFFSMPAERTEFSQTFDFTETHGVEVEVEAGIDYEKRLVWWEFTSIDPETNMIPWDPTLGFLPINRNSPEGEGFVTYTIRPRAGLATGTRVEAEADIVFDLNDPIVTPKIFHTIDAETPVSRVQELVPTSEAEAFLVSWTGSDGGSGIAGYDIYVSEDGGEWTRWLANTADTSALFTGQSGRRYSFLSVARDHARQAEPTIVAAQATTVAGGAWDPKFDIAVERSPQGAVMARLSYNGRKGYEFMIDYRDSLGGGADWRLLLEAPLTQPGRVEVSDAAEVSARFYRLRWEPAATSVWDSGLEIAATPLANGRYRAVLTWTAEEGYDYTVETTPDLTEDSGWQALPGEPHAAGTVIDESTMPRKFYRLRRVVRP